MSENVKTVESGQTEEGVEYRTFQITRSTPRLLPAWVDKPLMDILMKAVGDDLEASTQGDVYGPVCHPFDMAAASRFSILNAHHSTCIQTKAKSTVGLGFVAEGEEELDPMERHSGRRKKRSKVAKACDPICRVSFQDVQNDVAEDFYHTGNGYMEIVRADNSQTAEIRGIHHASAPDVFVILEQDGFNYHYEVRTSGGQRKFARFGDLDGFMERIGSNAQSGQTRFAELIHFREASSLAKWYGFPSWLSAVAAIELVNAQHKHLHGFFHNRGVPEFFLFIMGKKVGRKDWEKIEQALDAQIGAENSHKSAAVNIPEMDVTVQLEKLALEGKGDSREFSMMSETLAMEIVSAHRVPPLLAGILIPGKLGASNELPNAMRAFQALVVGPAQETFSTTLGCTLGDSRYNQGLNLTEEDFVYRTILDEVDMSIMETSAQMRQTEPEAAAEGRDLSEGLRKELEDAGKDGETSQQYLARTLAWAINHLIEKRAA